MYNFFINFNLITIKELNFSNSFIICLLIIKNLAIIISNYFINFTKAFHLNQLSYFIIVNFFFLILLTFLLNSKSFFHLQFIFNFIINLIFSTDYLRFILFISIKYHLHLFIYNICLLFLHFLVLKIHFFANIRFFLFLFSLYEFCYFLKEFHILEFFKLIWIIIFRLNCQILFIHLESFKRWNQKWSCIFINNKEVFEELMFRVKLNHLCANSM